MRRVAERPFNGPPLAILAAAMLIAVALPADTAALPLSLAHPKRAGCATQAPAALARAARQNSVPSSISRSVSPILGQRGELMGRTLSATASDGRRITRTLPAESFVAPPTGALVLYGLHHPDAGSQILGIDTDTGCEGLLATTDSIARSAISDQSGDALYVHSVSSSTRADLGVTRYRLSDGNVELVVPPLPADERFGRTFATELRWSVAEDELAVQSCGFSACRTRILEVATGAVSTIDEPAQGSLVALSDARLIAFATCPGRPCEVLSFDRRAGDTEVVAGEALAAEVRADAEAFIVVIETTTGKVEVDL